jgi:hypothetical protein
LDRRLGGPQSRSGRGGEEKNSQHLLRLLGGILKSKRYLNLKERMRKEDIDSCIIRGMYFSANITKLVPVLIQAPRHEVALREL